LIAIALWKVSPATASVDCATQQLDAAVLDSDCIARPGLCHHFPRCVVRGKMRKCACQRLLEVSETATSPLRTAFVIALLMALNGVLSACGFKNTFNYGHGQGQCENCGGY
jgi:hypothetical protein